MISFGAGEPDFNTPEPICEAAIEALRSGFTKYTPTTGLLELKEAISQKLLRENKVRAEPGNIIVSCGAKHSLYNTMMVLVEPGDEVILLAPFWMTYYDQVTLAGGRPVIVDADPRDGFIPEATAIRQAVTEKTKAIVINSPCNPTGAVFPRETLKEIAALALRYGIWLICDEIYERLTYGVEHCSMASLGSDVLEQTITIGGCSKSFAMTGWRIGYAAAPAQVAKAMGNLQDAITSNPTSFAQKGALAAYSMDDVQVVRMRDEFQSRRDLMHQTLSEIEGIHTTLPRGAFYFFVDCSRFLHGRFRSDPELADFLLETAKVATVPGTVFGKSGYLRLSYTASKKNISEGIARIGGALADCL